MSQCGSQYQARNNRFRAWYHVNDAVALSATLLTLSGCLSGGDSDPTGRNSSSTNHPPVVKLVSILPTPLTLSGPLTVRVEAQDLDLQNVTFRYRWLVNGQISAGQTRESLQPELLKRGDQVAVEVTPFDGTIEGEPFRSIPVAVANTPPIISDVTVEFDQQSRRLLAKVDVVDPDHDPVSLTYRWQKNETMLKEGKDNTLDLAGLTATDSIQVKVTASDGTPDGITVLSQGFTLSNSPPTIVSNPSPSPNGDQYDYLVRATDADGDPITYALEVSPPGMTIEANTGRIHWNITPEAKGHYQVRVVAKDPQGGFATQDFDLSVKTLTQS